MPLPSQRPIAAAPCTDASFRPTVLPNRHAPRYRPLLAVAVCVGGGIALDRMVLPVAWPHGLVCWAIWLRGIGSGRFVWPAGLVGVGSWGLGWWRLASWLLLAAAVCLGGLWQHVRWNYFPSDDLGLFARETRSPVCVEAVALARPMVRPAPPANPLRAMELGPRSETLLRLERIRAGHLWQPAGGYCKLRVAGVLSDIHSGDRLLIFGQLGRRAADE